MESFTAFEDYLFTKTEWSEGVAKLYPMFVPNIDWEKTLALHSNEYKETIEYMESNIKPLVVSLPGSSETWVPCKLLRFINREFQTYKYRFSSFLTDVGEDCQVKRISKEDMRALGCGNIRCSFITWFAKGG